MKKFLSMFVLVLIFSPIGEIKAVSSYTNILVPGTITEFNAVAYDSNSGNVYVSALTSNIYLAKYTSNLVFVSSQSVTSPFSNDYTNDLVVAPNGDVYATGSFGVAGGDSAIWVGRFDSSLTLLSTVTINGDGPALAESGEEIILSSDGSVFVVGTIGHVTGQRNVWVGKYNSSLSVLMASASFTNTGGQNEYGNSIDLDSSNNIFVVGQVQNTGWVAKYDGNLTLVSSVSVAGFGSTTAGIHGNSLYVTGYSTANGFSNWIGKYNTDLVLQSSSVFVSFDPAYTAETNELVVDNQERIFVAGYLDQIVGTDNLMSVIQLNSSLVVVSSVTINVTGDDLALDVALGDSNYIYVSGITGSGGWISKHTIAGLSRSSVDSLRAFPNPFIPSQSSTGDITFDRLPAGAKVQIFTITGALVAELTANESGIAIWTGVRNRSGEKVASGVYYVFAEGNGSKKTTKVAIER